MIRFLSFYLYRSHTKVISVQTITNTCLLFYVQNGNWLFFICTTCSALLGSADCYHLWRFEHSSIAACPLVDKLCNDDAPNMVKEFILCLFVSFLFYFGHYKHLDHFISSQLISCYFQPDIIITMINLGVFIFFSVFFPFGISTFNLDYLADYCRRRKLSCSGSLIRLERFFGAGNWRSRLRREKRSRKREKKFNEH